MDIAVEHVLEFIELCQKVMGSRAKGVNGSRGGVLDVLSILRVEDEGLRVHELGWEREE